MRRRRFRTLVNTVIGLFLTAVMLFPLYWMINVSLTPSHELLSTNPPLFPQDPTFDGYRSALSQQLPSLATSITIGIGTAFFAMLIAIPAAYAMSKLRVRGSEPIMVVLLVAQLLPAVVLTMALFALYARVGLINTYPGLIFANATAAIPLSVIVLRAFMNRIPDELLEAARVDGAGKLRMLHAIVIPLSRNAIITASLLSFLIAWADFIFARSLTSGNEIVPFTLALFRFIGADTTNWNGVMATAVIASVPAILLLTVAQRYIAGGITAGSLKD
ncbi:MAG: ABC transporter permease [Actinobacteria bacterium HGW-Actinobacteria-4]|nr:MAG: ABC transporter permease [Actinobacteria bacterium HGW-Actinobacteria-4]